MSESRLTAADYDVDRVIAELVTGNSAATEKSYACVLRNYCIFNNTDYDNLSASDFDDSKVAIFLKDGGVRRLYSRSTEKTYCAALGSAFLKYGIGGCREFPLRWPLTNKVLQVYKLQFLLLRYSLICCIFLSGLQRQQEACTSCCD